jgi:hypothetical protein
LEAHEHENPKDDLERISNRAAMKHCFRHVGMKIDIHSPIFIRSRGVSWIGAKQILLFQYPLLLLQVADLQGLKVNAMFNI